MDTDRFNQVYLKLKVSKITLMIHTYITIDEFCTGTSRAADVHKAELPFPNSLSFLLCCVITRLQIK